MGMSRLLAALAALLLLGGCETSTQPSAQVVEWMPLAPNLVPPPQSVQAGPPPPLPEISLELPQSARMGQPFEYRMTLTESRSQPLDLVALCPTFEEELFADISNGSGPLGGKHLYSLNCKPVGTLKPGAQVTFRMVFNVPADAAPGTYTFMFGLGYWNAMSRVLQVPVTITK
jgi:hypothetical protein